MTNLEINKKTPRTSAQNRSLHLYCAELARLLNESGISQSVFYQNIEVDYSMENIKQLFRSIGKRKYGKDSTAKFTTREMSDIYEEVNRHTSNHGIHVPWPSIEEQINKER